MHRKPRVSAVITAYNGEQYIADAIESVLNQTMPVHELVVVDDGSTDQTAAVAQRYLSPRVRLISQENKGLPRARNRGLAETTGELICFLDCDDLWLPEKTQLQAQHLLEHDNVGLVTCDVWCWDVRTNQRQTRRLPIGETPAAIRRRLTIRNFLGNVSGIMLPRRVLDEVGPFDPSDIWAEDWELWRRIARRYQVSIIRRPLAVIRLVPMSLTSQRTRERADAYYATAKQLIAREGLLWRPLLLLQAIAWREHFRSIHARDAGRRLGYLRHALFACLAWPWEDFRTRISHLARALLGKPFYAAYCWLRRAFRRSSGPVGQVIGGIPQVR